MRSPALFYVLVHPGAVLSDQTSATRSGGSSVGGETNVMPIRQIVAIALSLATLSLGRVAPTGAQTAITAVIDVGSARLETVSWGDGEPVVLLPGSGYSSTAFGLLGPELARRG